MHSNLTIVPTSMNFDNELENSAYIDEFVHSHLRIVPTSMNIDNELENSAYIDGF